LNVAQLQDVADSEKGQGDPDRGAGVMRMLAILLVSFVLYALSTGPVIKLCLVSSKRVPPPVDVMYKPLEFCYDHSDAVRHFFDWYFHVCGVK